MRKHRLFIALAVFLMLSVFCCAFVACGDSSVGNTIPPITTPSDSPSATPPDSSDPPEIPTPQPPSEPENPPKEEPEAPPTTDPEAPDTEKNPPSEQPEQPPVTEPEIPPSVDPTPPTEEDPPPTQTQLTDSIGKTLWTDGDVHYRFNDDGSVDTLSMSENGAISFAVAEFTWKYDNDFLYFADDENSELVEILTEPQEKIKSTMISKDIVRSDGILINGYRISERNIYARVTVLYENNAVVLGDGFTAFSDELAMSEVSVDTETVFIYPSDIHKVVIAFGEGSFDSITLHNYIGDNYIISSELSLPAPNDENFIGWQYDDIIYRSICDIMFDLSDNENIELIAAYKQPEEPETPEVLDPIIGTYTYTSKTGEYTIAIDKDNNFTIYNNNSEAEELSVKWSKSAAEENIYILEDDNGTLELTESGIEVNSKEIKKLLTGKTIGSCVLTKKADTE